MVAKQGRAEPHLVVPGSRRPRQRLVRRTGGERPLAHGQVGVRERGEGLVDALSPHGTLHQRQRPLAEHRVARPVAGPGRRPGGVGGDDRPVVRVRQRVEHRLEERNSALAPADVEPEAAHVPHQHREPGMVGPVAFQRRPHVAVGVADAPGLGGQVEEMVVRHPGQRRQPAAQRGAERAEHHRAGRREVAGADVQHPQPHVGPDVRLPVDVAGEPHRVAEPAFRAAVLPELARQLRHLDRERGVAGPQQRGRLGEGEPGSRAPALLGPVCHPPTGVQQARHGHRALLGHQREGEHRHPQRLLQLRPTEQLPAPHGRVRSEGRAAPGFAGFDPQHQVAQPAGQEDAGRAGDLADDLGAFGGRVGMRLRRGRAVCAGPPRRGAGFGSHDSGSPRQGIFGQGPGR